MVFFCDVTEAGTKIDQLFQSKSDMLNVKAT